MVSEVGSELEVSERPYLLGWPRPPGWGGLATNVGPWRHGGDDRCCVLQIMETVQSTCPLLKGLLSCTSNEVHWSSSFFWLQPRVGWHYRRDTVHQIGKVGCLSTLMWTSSKTKRQNLVPCRNLTAAPNAHKKLKLSLHYLALTDGTTANDSQQPVICCHSMSSLIPQITCQHLIITFLSTSCFTWHCQSQLQSTITDVLNAETQKAIYTHTSPLDRATKYVQITPLRRGRRECNLSFAIQCRPREKHNSCGTNAKRSMPPSIPHPRASIRSFIRLSQNAV